MKETLSNQPTASFLIESMAYIIPYFRRFGKYLDGRFWKFGGLGGVKKVEDF